MNTVTCWVRCPMFALTRMNKWLLVCLVASLTWTYITLLRVDTETLAMLNNISLGQADRLPTRRSPAPGGLPLHRILPYLHGVNPAEVERRPMLLAYSFGCTGCGEVSVEEWACLLARQRKALGVIVVLDAKEQVKELQRRKGWCVPVVADDGSIARILNPAFSPQAFGFARGRLVWVQRMPGVPEAKLLDEFYHAVR